MSTNQHGSSRQNGNGGHAVSFDLPLHSSKKEEGQQQKLQAAPPNPNLISFLGATIKTSVNPFSQFLGGGGGGGDKKKKKKKEKKKKVQWDTGNGNGGLIVSSPNLQPPQAFYNSDTSSSSIYHDAQQYPNESLENIHKFKSAKSFKSFKSAKSLLRTQDSVLGCNVRQYDKRAAEIFPSTFNLVSGSYDALISDTAVLVKNEESEKMGGFTDSFIRVLNFVHEQREKKNIMRNLRSNNGNIDSSDDNDDEDDDDEEDYGVGCSWEVLLRLMREQLIKDGYQSVPQLLSTRLLDIQKQMTIVNDLYGGFGTGRAVLIGINYVGQKGELTKCHNDVNNIAHYLQTKQGFQEKNIVKLMDDGIHTNPTKDNIMDACRKVARQSAPGDSVFILYSGHGGHIVDESGDEEDGFDETLIPVDFQTAGQIVDDDLSDEFVKRISKGVLVTALMDPHHGGTVLDLPYYFTGEAMKRSYDPFEAYPAEVFMISGCHDAQESVCTDPKKFLPSPHGRKSGAFTAALLKSLYDAYDDGSIKDLSWVSLLKVLRDHLCDKGFNQVPQLSSTKVIDVNKPLKITTDGTRRAVLIGINYVGKKNALPGCHNDVRNMLEYLITKEGFLRKNIAILMDDGKHVHPTHDNIMNAYKTIIEQSMPGDTVFLHFSGHGGQIIDESGDEDDGFDETIIPVDFETAGHILDDTLCDEVVKKFRKGVHVTALMDSCHSGTVLDLPYYFNGEGGVDAMERLEQFAFTDIEPVRPRICCFGRH